jgi:hypothetical protein
VKRRTPSAANEQWRRRNPPSRAQLPPRENAKRTDNGQFSADSSTAGGEVVHDESIGVKFFGQGDGLALADAQTLKCRFRSPLKAADFQPSRTSANPGAHRSRRPASLELFPDSKGNQDAAVERSQDFYLIDQHEVLRGVASAMTTI